MHKWEASICYSIYGDRVPNSHDMKRSIYDMNWELHQEFLGRLAISGPDIEKPKSFELMRKIAEKLSTPFPFVRVDFYDIKGKPVFGEMTFTPGMEETSTEFSEILGSLLGDINYRSNTSLH